MDALLLAAGSPGWPGSSQDRRGPPAASPCWGENAHGYCRSDGADHGSSDWRGSMTPEGMAAWVVERAQPGTIIVLHDRQKLPL